MAQPVFLSYSWSDPEVEELDTLLRWRGVPVWRDRRAMGFGHYQENEARRALRRPQPQLDDRRSAPLGVKDAIRLLAAHRRSDPRR